MLNGIGFPLNGVNCLVMIIKFFLRILFILAFCLAVFGGIFYLFFKPASGVTVESKYNNALHLQAKKAHIQQFSGKRQVLDGFAETFYIRQNSPDITFKNVYGKYITKQNKRYFFHANRALYMSKKRTLHLYDHVRLNLPNQFHIATKSLFVNIRLQKMFNFALTQFYSPQFSGTSTTLYYSFATKKLLLHFPKATIYEP